MEKSQSQPQPSNITQLHPYEYLTQLNSIYSTCNRQNAKSFSSVSKLKLAWKPFSIIKIPNFFEATYAGGNKGEKEKKLQNRQIMEQGERKLWKEHQEIVKRYYCTGENKVRQFARPQTCLSRKRKQSSNMQFEVKNTVDQSLIKKMIEKGVKIEHDKQGVKQEVIQKLKNIRNPAKQAWRAQSATIKTNIKKQLTISKNNQENINPINGCYFNERPYTCKQRKDVDENEYLVFHKSSEIIENYKTKIKQVDCAISEFNIQKTAALLKNMENIVEDLE